MDTLRLKKAQAIRKDGEHPYSAMFDRSHSLAEAYALPDGESVSIAGRVVLFRDIGKLTFATLQDHTGRLQIAFKSDELGDSAYKCMLDRIDLGDFVGIHGERFITKKGEPTVRVKKWNMLSKALRAPPEKWHGIENKETAWRQRYLDLTTNRDTFDRFTFRSLFIRKLREFYWSNTFVEMETPVLVNAASGALATPFQTHHDAYDLDVYLRIAPEIFLKKCIIGGFDRVFEIARVFRNEGLDPSHLQDFTMAEHYATYWDYKRNMRFTEEMLSTLVKELMNTSTIKIYDRDGNLVDVDFNPPWPILCLTEVIKKDSGIDISDCRDADTLRLAMQKKNITLDVEVENLAFGNLTDQLYKKISRPKIVQPTFITHHPVELSPLSRLNDDDPRVTDRFQLVVGGWEIVNAYSELVDPVDQAKRFEQQAKAHAKGDRDAHGKDDEYVKALEYGCPPCSGFGMGIDRIVALLTKQTNLRDVVLFPLLKPDLPSS